MKLVSWNLFAGGFRGYTSPAHKPEKLNEIIEAIRGFEADFVSLVDVYRWKESFTTEELKRLFDFKHVFVSGINDQLVKGYDPGIGVAVMTNLEVVDCQRCWIGTRFGVKTTVRLSGSEVDIFSVYLDNSQEERRVVQTEALIDLCQANQPTVICGDLNTIKRGELQGLTKAGLKAAGLLPWWRREGRIVEGMNRNGVISRLEAAGFRDTDGTEKQKTIPSHMELKGIFGPFLRLDYILGNQWVKVSEFEVIKEKRLDKLSDHYPITAHIEVKTTK